MADVIYKFDNTPFGGSQSVELSTDEMPDYFQIGQESRVNTMRATGGKIWQYVWYKKMRSVIQFRSVGSAILATMGSIANENVQFLWYKDINTPNSGTHLCAFVGDEFAYTPLTPYQYDFDFEVEDRV